MRKSVLALLGLVVALGMLDAAPASAQFYLPMLDITYLENNTDSPIFSDRRISIYRSGDLVLQSTGSGERCAETTLAIGTGSEKDMRRLRRALTIGQVGVQEDCGLGTGFGTNLQYQLRWHNGAGRENSFRFGSYYRTGCPAGVARIRDAVDAYVSSVLSDPKTKIIRRSLC